MGSGSLIENALIGFVAALHLGFMILEGLLWTKPLGLKIFKQSSEKAKATRVLAMNQGLYNGFLAAGLLWSLLHSDPTVGRQLQLFFLSCVVIAGVFGGATASRGILWIQAMPGLAAFILVY